MRPIIAELRKLGKQYGVKVLFRRLPKDLAGQSDYEKNTIIVNNLLVSRQAILSAAMHEIGHCVCHQNGTFYDYHHTENDETRMKTALKAERYVDRWASFHLYFYDKRLKYIPSYSGNDKELRDFLEKYYADE